MLNEYKHITHSGGIISSSLRCPDEDKQRREFLYHLTRDNLDHLKANAIHENDFFGINPLTLELSIDRAQEINGFQKNAVFSQKEGFLPLGRLREIIDNFQKPIPNFHSSVQFIRNRGVSQLGAVSSANQNTIYILSCDGGGIRGYGSSIFADLFFQQWGIDQKRIFDYFDIICGTSTGSILGSGMGYGVTPSTIANFYLTEGPWIFSTSSIFPSQQATLLDLGLAILGVTSSAYSNTRLISALNAQFGTTKMEDMDTNLILPSIRANTYDLSVFSSNIAFPNTMGSDYYVKDAILASAALPIYLPTVTLSDGFAYWDGGIWANNPIHNGIAYGKYLKPFATRICILSLGTGRGDIGFDNPSIVDPPPYPTGIEFVLKLVDLCLGGSIEGNSLNINVQSSIPFPEIYYYRFQYVVDTDQNPNSSDNTSPEAFEYQASEANNVFESDIVNINAFIDHLNA